MSDRWYPAPLHQPLKCFLTGQSGSEAGPYYCAGRYYSEVGGDDRELQMTLSATAIREVTSAPGSPFALLDKDTMDALEATVESIEDECADKNARIIELDRLWRRGEHYRARDDGEGRRGL